MNAALQNIADNPILLRELRRRMRGRGLTYGIITYIVAMAISTILVILVYTPSSLGQSNVEMLSQMRLTGERIFQWITWIQSALVLILAPAITAGLTTTEKERQTFDFLRVTTITRWMYILGCFLSTTFYVMLALICALPLIALSFLYGGVALDDVLRTFLQLLTMSCLLSSVGLFVSSICEKTRNAQGIVVGMIFALFFLSLFLLMQIKFVFAGATTVAADEEAMAGQLIFLMGLGLPMWVFSALILIILTGFFLLLAARKLFDPEDTRALSHLQFALVLAAVLAAGYSLSTSNNFQTDTGALLYLALLYTLLLGGISIFAVGRMEVGDEMWQAKRLIPALRPFDESIPYLLFLLGTWWIAIPVMWQSATTSEVGDGFLGLFLTTSLASLAFFCVAGRTATALLPSKGKAALASLFAMVLFLALVPLFITILHIFFPAHSGIIRELSYLSPFSLLLDASNNPNNYQTLPAHAGRVAIGVYLTCALLLAIVGETIRYRRWRGFDYHYDMPAR
jgi:hypothetical protein